MRDAYWPEWEQVVKNYKCIVDVRKDSDGKEDPDKTHIGMPDTFALVNRRTARITAQMPNVGFIADERDEEIEKSVSHKVMSDWDNGRIQRQQKPHVRQAELLGWSVRSWWWEVAEHERRKGIDVSRPLTPPELDLIAKTYEVDPAMLSGQQAPVVLKALVEAKGKRGLLDVRYLYKSYEGPRSEVLFSGDCYPEPFFGSIQQSNWFIVELRRNKEWLVKIGKRYPELQAGIEELLGKYPKGTPASGTASGDDGYSLRDQLRNMMGKPTTSGNYSTANSGTQLWNILARWIPGAKPTVAYVSESIFLGEIPSPYDLDGKIPFTDLILLDDILGGVGDSVSRITMGLQEMHNIETNRRFDLYRHITHPMLGTTDLALYDNPQVLRREAFRLIHMRQGPGSLWPINDQAAVAAMTASMSEEAAIQRMFQMAGGDSNMSMSANVDPSQMRTATGAKILQANSDVLTKDMVDMLHETSVKNDVEMIYLFNRSEMSDAVPIDAAKYQRNYDQNFDARKAGWIQSEPRHFQVDGKLTVELGSTMADDDEGKVVTATNLFQMLQGNPFVNQETLTKDLLIAHGKGPKLAEYMQQQQPPPPVLKGTVTMQFDAEKTDEATKRAVLAAAGIAPESVQQMQQQVQQEAAAQAQPQPPPMDPAAMAPPPLDPTNLMAAGGA